ncbi:MAG: sigma-54 dependent transcriptional regulator [Desulfobacteraceae bacterium]|nr:sigma-54 dependent transcriptional regulator [Desulfobacteraceae bacterium]
MDRETLLIVDDEAITRENLAHSLGKKGYRIVTAANGAEAIERLVDTEIGFVLTDLRMHPVDGLEVLARARKLQPAAEVVVVTGYASVDTAVEAMRRGAYHYIAKPIQIEELGLIVEKALEKRRLKKEVRDLRRRVADQSGLARIVGQSQAILALKEMIRQVAALDCTVLIAGETGTGKELVARAVHELSPRADHRFMAVNCGAFSPELIANELFGHEREAFTGAGREKKGLLEAASGGSVFLDEIGDLPLPMQVNLLRVLQERSFRRVGGTQEITADIRVLAATNKDLKKEAERGAFRQDLYYRLNVIALHLPNLAERREDIPLLVRHFIAKHTPVGAAVKTVAPEVMDRLQRYDYPGNVRELENIVARGLALCDGPQIDPPHLLEEVDGSALRIARREPHPWPTLEENERRYILAVMEEVGGNKTRAARILNIDRVSLWRKLKRYQIDSD